MAQKRYSPEQIVMKLREADRLREQGLTVEAVARRLRVTSVTLRRWRERYGALQADEAARLRDLELENERLKRIVVEKELEITVLRDVAKGKF